MTGLAGDQFQVARGERMLVSGRSFVPASVMAVFAGMHAVVQIVSYRLLEGIPFGKIMFFIAWMTGDTVEALCFMDIPFRIPLTACPSSIGCGMAEPTTLIRRPPYD